MIRRSNAVMSGIEFQIMLCPRRTRTSMCLLHHATWVSAAPRSLTALVNLTWHRHGEHRSRACNPRIASDQDRRVGSHARAGASNRSQRGPEPALRQCEGRGHRTCYRRASIWNLWSNRPAAARESRRLLVSDGHIAGSRGHIHEYEHHSTQHWSRWYPPPCCFLPRCCVSQRKDCRPNPES